VSEQRKNKILKAIVEIFINTASPVGSKFLKEEAGFEVSSATIRNEMAQLEKEGFLQQSHISGGRIPTALGYRFFVEELQINKDFKHQVQEEFQHASEEYFLEKKADETVHDMLSVLTKLTPNIAFSTVPSSKKTFFLGISQMLMLPEFSGNAQVSSGIFRILEEKFYELLHSLNVGEEVELFIGKENIFPEMESCSLLVSRFKALEEDQFFGILGPMRMDYAKNIVALQEAKKLYEHLI
jgi:transcriptional regulator of heat shock response